MPITKEAKAKTIKKHQKKDGDTGSLPITIALLSQKIDELASHLQEHKKDKHSRRGLMGMVTERRKLLITLMESDRKAYEALTKELGLKTKAA